MPSEAVLKLRTRLKLNDHFLTERVTTNDDFAHEPRYVHIALSQQVALAQQNDSNHHGLLLQDENTFLIS